MLTFEAIAAGYPPNLRGFRRNILREYLQYKILQIIFNSRLAPKLSFIGGTALRIVHGSGRFSEDLDFDNFGLTKAEFEQLAAIVKAGLEKEGYEVETRNVYKLAFRCYIKFPRLLFESGLTPIEEEKILVQLDTYGHGFKYQPETVILNKFDVFSEIFVTPADILLAQKIFAAMTRKRPRGTKPNYEFLKMKMNIGDAKTLRKRLVSFCRNLDWVTLSREVQPFLISAGEDRRVAAFPRFIKTAEL